jgi:hypothetical protein
MGGIFGKIQSVSRTLKLNENIVTTYENERRICENEKRDCKIKLQKKTINYNVREKLLNEYENELNELKFEFENSQKELEKFKLYNEKFEKKYETNIGLYNMKTNIVIEKPTSFIDQNQNIRIIQDENITKEDIEKIFNNILNDFSKNFKNISQKNTQKNLENFFINQLNSFILLLIDNPSDIEKYNIKKIHIQYILSSSIFTGNINLFYYLFLKYKNKIISIKNSIIEYIFIAIDMEKYNMLINLINIYIYDDLFKNLSFDFKCTQIKEQLKKKQKTNSSFGIDGNRIKRRLILNYINNLKNLYKKNNIQNNTGFQSNSSFQIINSPTIKGGYKKKSKK